MERDGNFLTPVPPSPRLRERRRGLIERKKGVSPFPSNVTELFLVHLLSIQAEPEERKRKLCAKLYYQIRKSSLGKRNCPLQHFFNSLSISIVTRTAHCVTQNTQCTARITGIPWRCRCKKKSETDARGDHKRN